LIELSTSPTSVTVTATGDLDLAERASFPELTARVSGLRRQLVVIDLCAVDFLDSTGAAFLISLADLTRRRGGVAVHRGASERVLYVLRICGALDSFRVDTAHRCPPAEPSGPWRAARA
jgi:anti-anti-sigma factor